MINLLLAGRTDLTVENGGRTTALRRNRHSASAESASERLHLAGEPGEQLFRNCDLSELERHIAPLTNDLSADLDQLLAHRGLPHRAACMSLTGHLTT